MRVHVDAPAKTEVRDAVAWYLETCGPQVAQGLRAEMRRVVSTIARNPRMWPEVEPGIRRALLTQFPYSLLYIIDDEGARIFAFAHQRREPGYWRRR